ncbi:carbohydrate ABC transporter permease [Eisenbergiella sp.]
MSHYLNNKKAIICFISPALVMFTVMVFYPIVQTVGKSFTDWDGLTQANFIGLKNYQELLKDPIFYTALKNGLIFACVITVIQLVIGTILALAMLDTRIRFRKFLRISYFIPVVLSVTVVCQLWMSLYNAEYGLINKIFEAVGLSYRQDWLSGEKSALYAVIAANAWQYMGYHFILLLTSAKSVPEQYFEAARIDGCSRWEAHWRITIPLMRESYKFCLVLAITGGLNAFAQMYIMTKGGPGTSTYTLTYLMQRSAFKLGEYGYGCASATVLVVECLIATILINRFMAEETTTY